MKHNHTVTLLILAIIIMVFSALIVIATIQMNPQFVGDVDINTFEPALVKGENFSMIKDNYYGSVDFSAPGLPVIRICLPHSNCITYTSGTK